MRMPPGYSRRRGGPARHWSLTHCRCGTSVVEGAGMTTPFGAYQAEIYLNGLLNDEVPPFTTNPEELEASARERLESGPFWYVAGGAGNGATVRANRAAFDRWRIVPRM